MDRKEIEHVFQWSDEYIKKIRACQTKQDRPECPEIKDFSMFT